MYGRYGGRGGIGFLRHNNKKKEKMFFLGHWLRSF
jgi:hypothetical protein